MRNKVTFLFVLFLVGTFLFSNFSLSMGQPINDDPKDGIVNDGPWADPSNQADFFLGNTEEFSVQNVFVNGKPLNPSIYFFTIHREVFVPVRVITYALGGKVYWDAVKRKVYVNGKELNTTRVILGPTCYVPLRSVAKVFNAKVAYDTKNHAAAVWSKHPAEIGYPVERWYIGTTEYYDRLHNKIKAQQENAKLEAAKAQLEQQGITGVDDNYIKKYVEEGQPTPGPQGPVAPPPPPPTPPSGIEQPTGPDITTQPPVQQPPTQPEATPTKGPDPFNFGF